MSGPIRCPKCGHLNSPNRVTCKVCKTNLEEALAKQPAPAEPPEPTRTPPEQWEYLKVRFWPSIEDASQIFLWPQGAVELKWLSGFGATVTKEHRIDVVTKSFEAVSTIPEALMQYLGLNGWEAVSYSGEGGETVFFKRLKEPDWGELVEQTED